MVVETNKETHSNNKDTMETNNPVELIHIGSRRQVELEQVIMLQADLNYTYVHLLDGSSILVSCTLKKMAERFVAFDYFIRPNKSVVLNMQYITSFDGSLLQISFPSGEVLKNTVISRRKKKFINQKMNNFNDYSTANLQNVAPQ